ncbi:sensor histidine kinase [Streptosporangium carneum]|uniref:histidine kinase n=1 Tax=Streptosporangium carneum TaxID=47481 RepID=A0A9W6HXY0_9ACTN|nr:sensor histidine kinase [Streptosporangium carneum]GLK08385.1 two-component sensor histidine kinase [Streptosporangium carneum]
MNPSTSPSALEQVTAALRSPFANPRLVGDVLVTSALTLIACAEVVVSRLGSVPVLVAAVMATAPHVGRHIVPRQTVALTLLGALGLGLAGFRPDNLPIAVYVSGLLSFYTLLRMMSRRAAWLLTGCVTLVMAAAGLLLFARRGVDGMLSLVMESEGTWFLLMLTAVVGTAFLADTRRSRTEIREVRADNLESLREQAAMAERARIAREMHDIVAHSVSMIAVQAETAPYTLGDLDDRTKQEFAEIATSARTTLTEMRRLLGVLRADVTTAPETAPQPGLARLPELLEQYEGEADLDVVGEAAPVPQAVDVSAYRIVQEALTNARVHARGARVSIELTYRPGLLVLRIADDGPGPSGDTSNGHGLVGMRERALALGGWFQAGPGPSGGFLIQAGLPLE